MVNPLMLIFFVCNFSEELLQQQRTDRVKQLDDPPRGLRKISQFLNNI